MPDLRVLLLSDTHVGFDTPRHARIARRRRGPDFLASFERGLEPALRGVVDLVVHAGDLFHRSRPSAAVAEQGLGPLRRVAESGVPVVLLPGNHERSRIPFPLFAAHPNLHVFHGPGTFRGTWGGARVAVSGFPFVRRVGGRGFADELARTGFDAHADADVRLLVLHQAVEGARVGPADFMFRSGSEVISGAAIPDAFDAVLVGHIHRHQVLTHDLAGRPLGAPVVFCGSTERTSFAEQHERKGTVRLGFEAGGQARWQFQPLPTRPMHTIALEAGAGALERAELALAPLPSDAIVRLAFTGSAAPPPAAALRALAPEMNLTTSMRSETRTSPAPRVAVSRGASVRSFARG